MLLKPSKEPWTSRCAKRFVWIKKRKGPGLVAGAFLVVLGWCAARDSNPEPSD